MDVNREGRRAASRPGREEEEEEVVMGNRGDEGPPGEAGQTVKSRVQLISSVYRREAFGGVQRGGVDG